MIQPKDQKFIELAHLLAPDDESLAEDVQETLEEFVQEEPKFEPGFDPENGHYVVEIVPPSLEEMVWETIVDGLFVRDKLVSIDQEQSPEMVAEDIDALLDHQPPDPHRWAWVNFKERSKDLPHIFLKEVQERVIGPGWLLAILQDINSTDVYPVCLVAAADYPAIERVLGEIGYGSIEKVVDMKSPQGVY